jgi:hypothetical protein
MAWCLGAQGQLSSSQTYSERASPSRFSNLSFVAFLVSKICSKFPAPSYHTVRPIYGSEREVDLSPQSSAEVRNVWSVTSAPQCAFVSQFSCTTVSLLIARRPVFMCYFISFTSPALFGTCTTQPVLKGAPDTEDCRGPTE